jgi:hypothetical protein
MFQVTVMLVVPAPAVITPPEDIDQVYAVMPVSVVYIFPVEFTQTDAGPVIVGTGKIFTVTDRLELDPFIHIFVPYTVTFPEDATREKLTVMVLVFAPAVMVPPAGSDHIYPVAPVIAATV